MSEPDYAAELDAVLAVVDRETRAFWDKDFHAWSDCWAHVAYTRTMGYWLLGGVSVVEGWAAQSELIRRMMAENPQPNPSAGLVRRENINARIFADAAWVTFDQFAADTGDPVFDMPGRSRETRILEKHDGHWKIVYAGWLLVGEEVKNLG